jgi:hypothetical protein
VYISNYPKVRWALARSRRATRLDTAKPDKYRSLNFMLLPRTLAARFWLMALIVTLISGASIRSAPSVAPAYPVKVSANLRYLVDQNNTPFLITGDSPQSLMVNLTTAQADSYFSNRQSYGFNTVWINLVCNPYTGGREDGTTYDGILPFSGYLPGGNNLSHFDLSKPNEIYFVRCDQMISLAAKYHLLVFLDAIEPGGFLTNMLNNGPDACYNYGKFVGDRYKKFDNIVWLNGNDFQTWRKGPDDAVVIAVTKGIEAADPRRVQTIELDYNISLSTDDPAWEPIINLNAAYTYSPTYAEVLKGYNRHDAMPVFMVEAAYEFESNAQEHMATPATLRREEYWSNLSGATGLIYGNHYTWTYAQGWQDHLDTPGASQMGLMRRFFESHLWYNLVPDQDHTALTAGFGTFSAKGAIDGSDYATAARTPDGRLLIVYAPTIRALTIDMTRLSGPVTANWFDPSQAAYSPISGSPFSNKGSQTFTPPGKNHDGDEDWVLVLETMSTTLP